MAHSSSLCTWTADEIETLFNSPLSSEYGAFLSGCSLGIDVVDTEIVSSLFLLFDIYELIRKVAA
jgi:hypothetical protein